MISKQNNEIIEKIQQGFEDEKKKSIIQEQENELAKQKLESAEKDKKIYQPILLLYRTVSGILILFGLSFTLYNGYNYKKKARAELGQKNLKKIISLFII